MRHCLSISADWCWCINLSDAAPVNQRRLRFLPVSREQLPMLYARSRAALPCLIARQCNSDFALLCGSCVVAVATLFRGGTQDM